MKKNKVKLILSIVFSGIAIVAFLYCLYLLGCFIYEMNQNPPECTSSPCVYDEGEPIIMILYIVSMIFVGIIDALAISFSIINIKENKLAKKLLVGNISMSVLEIIILIFMAIIV